MRSHSYPVVEFDEIFLPIILYPEGKSKQNFTACSGRFVLRRPGAGGRKRYPLATASATRIPSTAADTMPPA